MPYGIIKIDTVTFTNAGVDKSVTLSGLVQNPVFSGNVTVTGTLSGVTVTGTTANFTSGNFTNISGGTHTITSGVFAAGSAASPSITFTGDLNTGIYSPGADQVAISTGGSGRLFVDSNGRVGVGASPSVNLHVVGSADTIARVTAANGSTALLDLGTVSAPTAGRIFYDNGNNLGFSTNGSEKLRITSAGLVGVGTSSPSATLYVNNASGVDPSLTYGATAGQTFKNGTTELAFGAATTAPFAHWMQARFSTNAAQPLLLNPLGGNVGIGTTSPAEALVVEGKVWVGNTSAEPASTSDRGDITITNDTGPADILFLDRGLAATRIGVDTGDSGNFKFVTDKEFIWRTGGTSYSAFNTGSERARIDSSGRLLIGTSSSSSTAAGFTPAIQAVGTNATASAAVSITRYGNDSTEGVLSIAKSRGTLGVQTVVTSDDSVGRIDFEGSNGSTFLRAASIQAAIDGTVSGGGVGDMPGRIVLSTTADGASSPTPRMTIKSNGNVGIGTASPASTLHVVGTAQINTGNSADGLLIRREFNNPIDLRLRTFDDSAKDYIIRNDNGTLRFIRNATEVAQLDTSGRLLVGTSTNTDNNLIQTFNNGIGITSFSADQYAYGNLVFTKSRGTTAGSKTVVVSGDELGGLYFQGADGTNYRYGAAIAAVVDGTPGANDMPGRLVFSTTSDGASSPTERMRITNGGYLKASNSGAYLSSTSTEHEIAQSGQSNSTLVARASNGSYQSTIYYAYADRAANVAYNFFVGNSGAGADNEFVLAGNGQAYADGSWNGGGADYAEFFEWADSNPDSEDRRGISVVLDGDKIREALTGEDPIGVISGNPSVVGDAAWNKWSGKYLRDEFGTYILEENGDRQLNPAYDPDMEYISREQRPEWDCVGLMGKLRIRKGQVTGSRWIKMRDINDSVEEWLVR